MAGVVGRVPGPHGRQIPARPDEKLSGGAKSLLGNKGYARFLKMAKGSLKINEEAVAAEARYDGKFVLRTNTDLPAAEVAQTYKSLWRVERTFRETKSTLEVRPIFHHNDETTIGHIVARFLALRLEVDLRGAAHQAFQAAGMRPPSPVTMLA